jgi:acetamidase/formamidase
MRKRLMKHYRILACCALALAAPLSPASAGEAIAQQPVMQHYLVTTQVFGTVRYFRLDLDRHGQNLGGRWNGNSLEGTATNTSLSFVAKDRFGGSDSVQAVLKDGALSGTIISTESIGATAPYSHPFTATLIPERGAAPPRRHDFVPTAFHRQFSAQTAPVLTIAPGDIVHTITVDAGGVDAAGVKRSAGGNPQTGPFYVETAMPGDILAVHITRLRLNRDWAGTSDSLVESALNSRLAVMTRDNGKPVRWHLDRERGVAIPENPDPHLAGYSVPLRPMLGCVGVAPGPADAPAPTGDSGSWGGNMDFNEIVEGSTVYLPVRNPGALLYVGDGHAVMGDGELNGNALETSLDLEFTVDVLPGGRMPGPRVESATHIMAMGLSGSLDDAFKSATANMAQWLTDDYALTPSEVAQVIGTAAEYRISEVADRNSGIVLKIDKARLRGLSRTAK